MHRYSADSLTRYPSIDFDILCPFWDFFETDGLSTNIVELAHFITSPVLLLGSGQGIVARALIDIGHSVTSIDKSATMQAYPKARRGIVGIIGSIGSVGVGNRYSTTIINTGVITSLSLRAGIIDEINGLVHRGGRCKSMVLISYFRHCPFLDQCDKLGLFGHASNNHIFWLGRKSVRA